MLIRARAELVGGLLALRKLARADHDPVALAGELAGDLPPDAAVPARDESDAVYSQSEQSLPDSQQSQSQAMRSPFVARHPSDILKNVNEYDHADSRGLLRSRLTVALDRAA